MILPASAAMQRRINSLNADSLYIANCERRCRPCKEDEFSKAFREVREAAGVDKRKQFRDLRRTALSELGAAGATDQEIMSFSGHTTRTTLDVYVRRDTSMATSAMEKRERLRNVERRKSGKTTD